MSDLVPFGRWELGVVGLYLVSLLVIGWIALRARREDSMRDFYLAGGRMGVVVLLLTLYATQYSGNTLFGFTGKTYRIGFVWAMSVHFMAAIVVCYLLFAPQLFRRARRGGFITPTDYLDDRFGHRGLNLLATVVMIAAIANFLLAQLTAMGRALEGLTRLPSNQAFIYGVLILAAIILVYETLGGMRAVAWTDAIQGSILLIGFATLLVIVFRTFGSLEVATRALLDPETGAPEKVRPPSAAQCRQWMSYVVLVGIGGALYPQAIQRIYAAGSEAVLRRSLSVMVFLPFTTALVALVVGIIGAAHIHDLKSADADRVLAIICRHVQEQSTLGHWLVVILFAAILAAIMSTADSVLLSISSMLSKDIYRPLCRPGASEAELTSVGKISSVVLLLLLAGLAIFLNSLENKPTLIKLLDKKFDMLVQLAPAFMIGIHWKGLKATPVFVGLIAGLAVALGLPKLPLSWVDGSGKIADIHAGLFGLAVNTLIAVGGSVGGGERGAGSGERATRLEFRN
ncbi:MAG: hypothetical protein CMJ18_12970 [Phycisphaeraceae bacterium]|nr:hypothetical protein [Phycisphaeraceae bacterium]